MTYLKYRAFYKGRSMIVSAKSSLDAQNAAARHFNAKRRWDVAIALLETPVAPESL